MRWQRWEHPEWWLGVCAGIAWAVLLIGLIGELMAVAQGLVGIEGTEATALTGHHHGVTATGVTGIGMVASLLGWSLMIVAMMLPWAAPEARWLAHRSLGRRRTRTVFLYVGGFLGSWFLTAWVAGAAMIALTGGGTLVAAALLAGAAIWHILPVRRRALRRCGTGRLPAIRGVRADADCVASGVRSARRCIVTCGIAMMAMAAVHNIVLMAVITAISGSERRRGPNPEERIGRVREALALFATSIVLFVAATAGLV